jgi:hypothetical protein
MVSNPTELFNYYKNTWDDEIDYKIRKDLPRTSIGNVDFKIDPKTGKNLLYNVLNAYAAYDPEIGYC